MLTIPSLLRISSNIPRNPHQGSSHSPFKAPLKSGWNQSSVSNVKRGNMYPLSVKQWNPYLTLSRFSGEILASRVFIGLMLIALLGSHLIPFHLRSKGCATSPMGIPPSWRVPIFITPATSLWASKPQFKHLNSLPLLTVLFEPHLGHMLEVLCSLISNHFYSILFSFPF